MLAADLEDKQTGGRSSQPEGRYVDDEIDLMELLGCLWQHKWLVAVTTALVTAAALVYVLTASPVYRAELYLMPTNDEQLGALNLTRLTGGEVEYQVSKESAYREFLDALNSKRIRRKFFDENKLHNIYGPSVTQNRAFSSFEKALKLNLPKKGAPVFVTVGLEGQDAETTARLLNRFVEMALTQTLQRLADEASYKLNAYRDALKREITTKRSMAAQVRADQLVRLREAYSIAGQAGITTFNSVGNSSESGVSVQVTNSVPGMLFTRGTKTLQAEIDALKTRKSDDPFIAGLSGLKEHLKLVESIVISADKIAPAVIDQQAQVPEKPIKPKKILIVLSATMLGLMGGIMLAFFARFMTRVRQQQ